MTSNDPEMTIYDPENCLEQIQGYHKFRHEKITFKRGSLKNVKNVSNVENVILKIYIIEMSKVTSRRGDFGHLQNFQIKNVSITIETCCPV